MALSARRELPYAAWVTIQMGCDNSCAFCIVPQVRGPEVSRPFDDLVAEVRAPGARGVTEVTLLGQNVNSYGRDLTRRRPLFAELLRAVGAVDGIRRVRFTSPHPKDLRPETIAAMAETPAVCEHLHLPLQSGSDRVLTAMRRGYTRVALSRAAWPRRGQAVDDLAVTTDIIVGFPGETDDDFERTLEVAAEAEYDSAYTFIFSPRPGTRAADMTASFVPPTSSPSASRGSVWWWSARLCARHQARIGPRRGGHRRGREHAGPGCRHRPHPAEQAGALRPAGGVGPRPRCLRRRCLVTDAAPHHLRGELVRVTVPGRRRVPIPVSAR